MNEQSLIGRQVEQYLVQKPIKVGGMGAVYLAMDTMIDCAVALKFILSDFKDHPDMAKRFVEEAKTLSKLNLMNCPNIPILYRYFVWEGNAVMAMEYVPGETLEDLVRRRGPIPANVCVPLVRQALHGLSFAHRIGVIHRDLKPSNLMLNSEGTVKVIDFGIAKKIEVEAGLTKTNSAIGTPLYMAPEQIMGKPVTQRTDIYLMGLVLYELTAGQVPFNANSDFEISTAHVQKLPELPTIHYPHIPKQVVDAIMRALQKDPADRFQSVEEFLAALPDLPATQVQSSIASPSTAVTVSPLASSLPVSSPAVTPALVAQQPLSPIELQPYAAGPLVREDHKPALAVDTNLPAIVATGTSRKAVIAGACGLLLLVGGGGVWLLSSKKTERGPTTASTNTRAFNVTPPVGRDDTGAGETEPPPTAGPSRPINEAPKRPSQNDRKTNKPEPPPSGTPPGISTTPNTTPEPVPVPARPPGQELAGFWEGTYSDSSAPRDVIAVSLQIKELNGKNLVGTLDFVRADHTPGHCDLSRSIYSNQTLTLIPTNCNPSGVAPGGFNTPTNFSVADPTERSLSGTNRFFKNVSIQIHRR
jgi:serine/threonine protein kinase